MSLKILIVEDEMIIAEDMKEMLMELGYTIDAIANNYEDALNELKTQEIDIALIDINLNNQKDGIDLVEYINENYSIPTIYVSSNSDKATIEKAKKFKSNGFVVKPFSKEDLYTSIELAISNFITSPIAKNKTKEHLFIKDKDMFVKVSLDDILWLKSEQNYTEIITPQKRFLVRGTIKDTLDQLDHRFIRIQKSYVVNFEKITAINSSNVIINQQELPIGKIYKEEILQKINTLK
jgi:two-component system response regulator LytT